MRPSDHVAQSHPEFAPLALEVLTVVKELAQRAGVGFYVARSFASPERQQELFERGRKKVNGKWTVVNHSIVVTNARAHQSPHCITRNGDPAACAWDVALIENGKWLKNKDPRWGIIPAAVGIVSPQELVSGAFFRRPRDWAHFELRGFRELWEVPDAG